MYWRGTFSTNCYLGYEHIANLLRGNGTTNGLHKSRAVLSRALVEILVEVMLRDVSSSNALTLFVV